MTAPWILVPLPPEQRTEELTMQPMRYDVFVAKLFKAQSWEFMKLHAALGLCEEAGELAGCIKKHVIYQKPLLSEMKEDGKTLEEHIAEEAGDVLFYLQAVLNQFNMNFQDVLQKNADKLAKRYAELSYSDDAANGRADKPSGSLK